MARTFEDQIARELRASFDRWWVAIHWFKQDHVSMAAIQLNDPQAIIEQKAWCVYFKQGDA